MATDVALPGVRGIPDRRPMVVRLLESVPGTLRGTYKRNVIVWIIYLLVTLVASGVVLDAL